MSAIRILHVDDEPDIREIVGMALSMNPNYEVRACSSGSEAVATISTWQPSLILLDVMMPGMDGPTTLAELRKDSRTTEIPVVFMTARAQTREVEHFISLGAQGVISKPFDPMTLADQVGSHLQTTRMEALRDIFKQRARADAILLSPFQASLDKAVSEDDLKQIKVIAHGLAGTAGIYGFDNVSRDAAALEEAVIARLEGSGAREDVTSILRELLGGLARVSGIPQGGVA